LEQGLSKCRTRSIIRLAPIVATMLTMPKMMAATLGWMDEPEDSKMET
jgi:hypothetical protein